MATINFYTLDKSEKKAIFQAISNETRMPAYAVEKDWWVAQVMSVVFEMEVGKHLVFKGGTSLSKVWKLIQRFSEDVDLAIDRAYLGYDGDLSRSQRTALRKAASKYTCGPFLEELQQRLKEKGFDELNFGIVEAKSSDQDPRIIEIHYKNIIPTPGYVLPRVQIEIGCRSLREPFSVQAFGSLVDEIYADEDFAEALIQVPTVNPERTFLEKMFLLHEEFQRPVAKIRVDRLSRHLYDVYHLSNTEIAEKAMNNQRLYEIIVEHRQKFTKIGGVNYNKHNPKMINPIPIPEVEEAWKADYNRMLEEMIYEKRAPTYEMLIESLNDLKEKLSAVEWTFSKVFSNP